MFHKSLRALLLGVVLSACSKGADTAEMGTTAPPHPTSAPAAAAPTPEKPNPHAGMPGMPGMDMGAMDESAPDGMDVTGTVLETIDIASSKTMYYELDLGNGETLWVAAKQLDVKKGDKVKASEAIEMRDFISKTLNRTFPRLLMASEIEKVQ